MDTLQEPRVLRALFVHNHDVNIVEAAAATPRGR
jgi:hypothetical protein